MKKRIVLIGPKFFGYSSAIANFLNEKTEMEIGAGEIGAGDRPVLHPTLPCDGRPRDLITPLSHTSHH